MLTKATEKLEVANLSGNHGYT